MKLLITAITYHLHLLHHHFIVHNDMFHHHNHLYLPTAVSTCCHHLHFRLKEEEKTIDETGNKIYELPDLPKLQLEDWLLNTQGAEAEDILDDQFVNPKELEENAIEQIKDEYDVDKIKDAFDHAAVPAQLEFFHGGVNEDFVRTFNCLSPNEDNNEFVSFLCSDKGQNILVKNSSSIHVHFLPNFNTNENFYSFLLAQQDETKTIPKRIAYYHSFEKYIKSYLPSFSIEETEKFDLYANKN